MHDWFSFGAFVEKQALITKVESEESSVTLEESKEFLAEKEEKVKVESQPAAAGDDAEDLVSRACSLTRVIHSKLSPHAK